MLSIYSDNKPYIYEAFGVTNAQNKALDTKEEISSNFAYGNKSVFIQSLIYCN